MTYWKLLSSNSGSTKEKGMLLDHEEVPTYLYRVPSNPMGLGLTLRMMFLEITLEGR